MGTLPYSEVHVWSVWQHEKKDFDGWEITSRIIDHSEDLDPQISCGMVERTHE
jgi:hypothetical protein